MKMEFLSCRRERELERERRGCGLCLVGIVKFGKGGGAEINNNGILWNYKMIKSI